MAYRLVRFHECAHTVQQSAVSGGESFEKRRTLGQIMLASKLMDVTDVERRGEEQQPKSNLMIGQHVDSSLREV
jgi:hypothetical protein